MSRPVLRLILDVVLTIAVGLLLLAGWQWFLAGSAADAAPEAVRLLFNFMDVGLAVWVILLIVVLVRAKRVSAGITYLLLLAGAFVNLVVVIIVGFAQGGWAAFLVVFAVEAGVACLLAAAIVVPLVHRLVGRAAA